MTPFKKNVFKIIMSKKNTKTNLDRIFLLLPRSNNINVDRREMLQISTKAWFNFIMISRLQEKVLLGDF